MEGFARLSEVTAPLTGDYAGNPNCQSGDNQIPVPGRVTRKVPGWVSRCKITALLILCTATATLPGSMMSDRISIGILLSLTLSRTWITQHRLGRCFRHLCRRPDYKRAKRKFDAFLRQRGKTSRVADC